MIKVTSSETAKIYFKGSNIDATSVILFIQFCSRKLGTITSSIVSYSTPDDIITDNQLLVDFKYEIIVEDIVYKQVINIGDGEFSTNGLDPSLKLAQEYWKNKLEAAGYIVEVLILVN